MKQPAASDGRRRWDAQSAAARVDRHQGDANQGSSSYVAMTVQEAHLANQQTYSFAPAARLVTIDDEESAALERAVNARACAFAVVPGLTIGVAAVAMPAVGWGEPARASAVFGGKDFAGIWWLWYVVFSAACERTCGARIPTWCDRSWWTWDVVGA